MLFNSNQFFIFFPIVFVIYWLLSNKSIKIQNFLLLSASYYFYACWDWRFLFLLIFSTGLDYFTGIKMFEAKNQKEKKFWFWLSISINLGFLGIFKYYNFFVDSFTTALSKFGIHTDFWTLKIILPVGISFYTFHGLSYIIDIYKNRIQPEKNLITYSLFVSYFPLLVAGPIERATHLLPQIKKKRFFNATSASDGLRQILWGLFKKVVIADQCAEFANIIFNHTNDYSGSTLFLGAIFFTFQIYGDFSGYSDIAIGISKLLGIELIKNFNYPYFSRDIAEFWRRWHISLSTWFRDYLYIPLGGNIGNVWLRVRNVFIIFLVSGFWHGANWTFIIWGFLNAVYILPSIIFKTNRFHLDVVAKGKLLPSVKEFLQIGCTFTLTIFAWIFFRSTNLNQAFDIIIKIFSKSLFVFPTFDKYSTVKPVVFFTLLFILMEWLGRENNYAIEKILLKQSFVLRYFFYFLLILSIVVFSGKNEQFIYFQF